MELDPQQLTTKAPGEWFTGDVYITPLHAPRGDASRVTVGRVHFTPGARTAWHSHPLGQTLHIIEGNALIGTRDGTVISAHAGQTVYTPPGEEHWHGATPTDFMVHLAIYETPVDGQPAIWLEHVTDHTYSAGS